MACGSTSSLLRWSALRVWFVVAASRHDVVSSNATERLSPRPQVVHHDASVAPFLLDYNAYITVDSGNSSHLFAATDLQAQVFKSTGLRLPIVPLKSAFNLGYYIAVGTLDDPAIETLVKNRELPSPPPGINDRALFNGEGYRLDIRGGQGSDGVAMGTVIVGASPAGVFYGCQTFAQIVNNTAASHPSTGPGATFTLESVTITDWPSFHIRGMHVHELNPEMTDPGMMFFRQVDRMASHKMNFFSAMTTAGIPFDIPRYGEFELEMQQYCHDRHMTYVPSINLGQTLLMDGRTGEGIWAQNVSFTVQTSGDITPTSDPFVPLKNGNFEVGYKIPTGWTIVGASEANGSWTIDATQTASADGRSMRLDAPANVSLSARLISDPVVAEPGRTYQLSVFTRVSNTTHLGGSSAAWVWLVQLDASGNEIQGGAHLPTGVQIGTNK